MATVTAMIPPPTTGASNSVCTAAMISSSTHGTAAPNVQFVRASDMLRTVVMTVKSKAHDLMVAGFPPPKKWSKALPEKTQRSNVSGVAT
jgi:hypothetical protein